MDKCHYKFLIFYLKKCLIYLQNKISFSHQIKFESISCLKKALRISIIKIRNHPIRSRFLMTFCPSSISHKRYRNIVRKQTDFDISCRGNFDYKINFTIVYHSKNHHTRHIREKNASVARFSFPPPPLFPFKSYKLSSNLPSPLNEFEFRRDLTVKVTGVGDHRGQVLQLAQRAHDPRFLRLGLAHNRRTYLCRNTKNFASHSRTSAS